MLKISNSFAVAKLEVDDISKDYDFMSEIEIEENQHLSVIKKEEEEHVAPISTG